VPEERDLPPGRLTRKEEDLMVQIAPDAEPRPLPRQLTRTPAVATLTTGDGPESSPARWTFDLGPYL